MNHILKYLWYRTLSGIGLAALVLLGCANVAPPKEQIAVSKVAVTNAAREGGTEFAPVEMRTAQDKLNNAIQAMAAEDYKKAQLLAEQAQVDAQLATAKARSAKAQKAATTVEEDIRVLRKEIERKSQ